MLSAASHLAQSVGAGTKGRPRGDARDAALADGTPARAISCRHFRLRCVAPVAQDPSSIQTCVPPIAPRSAAEGDRERDQYATQSCHPHAEGPCRAPDGASVHGARH